MASYAMKQDAQMPGKMKYENVNGAEQNLNQKQKVKNIVLTNVISQSRKNLWEQAIKHRILDIVQINSL